MAKFKSAIVFCYGGKKLMIEMKGNVDLGSHFSLRLCSGPEADAL